MNKHLKLCMIGICVFITSVAHALPSNFTDFVYFGDTSFNPFTGQMDNNRIFLETNCHIDGFPDLGRSVICTADGTLVVDEDAQTEKKGKLKNIEGMITGIFALRSKQHLLVKLDKPASVVGSDCPSGNILIMPVSSGNEDDARAVTAVNALTFKNIIRFDLQGCVLGHPLVTDFEVLDCDNKECQEQLNLPLPQNQSIF
jgi:hypothetical protein